MGSLNIETVQSSALLSADNSGFLPLLTSVPVLHFPMKIKIGMTAIRVWNVLDNVIMNEGINTIIQSRHHVLME